MSTDTPDMHDLGELPPELTVAVDNSLVRLNAMEEVVEASVRLHDAKSGWDYGVTYAAWTEAVDNWKAVR